MERYRWPNAANYYAKAGNNAALVDTYYFLEVGNKFSSVGLCEQAVQAYLRHGDVKTAVDTPGCVLLNQWELAVNLAQQHNFQQIEGPFEPLHESTVKEDVADKFFRSMCLLAKYAQHLLDKNKKIEAVQLYRKASRHTEAFTCEFGQVFATPVLAAKLLNQMAREMPGKKVKALAHCAILASVGKKRFQVLATWLSAGVQSAIVFGFVANWPPYDKTDLSRRSPLWVQLVTRLLGLFNSETSGPFQGLDNALPLNITSENGMVCGLRLSPTSEKANNVVYLHGQAGNVVVQHRTELYKLLASRLGCEVIAIDYCSCGYSDFCWPSEASVVADVRAVLQSLPQAERDKVILWGHRCLVASRP
ncbi:Wdr35, partial [Symbiodinium sp. KB8]